MKKHKHMVEANIMETKSNDDDNIHTDETVESKMTCWPAHSCESLSTIVF